MEKSPLEDKITNLKNPLDALYESLGQPAKTPQKMKRLHPD